MYPVRSVTYRGFKFVGKITSIKMKPVKEGTRYTVEFKGKPLSRMTDTFPKD